MDDKASRAHSIPDLPVSIRALAGAGRVAIVVENLLRCFWPLGTVALVSLLLALFGFPAHLSYWGHIAFLALSGTGFALSLAYALWRFRLPSDHEVFRRIEQENNLDHRPLSSLADHPAMTTRGTYSLWQENRRRLFARLPKLYAPKPRPQIAEIDPLGLRALLFIGLFAASFSWEQWPDRLHAALTPQALPPVEAAALRYSLWFTPPDYTGATPLFFDQETGLDETLTLPQGSQLVIQAHGLAIAPKLEISGITANLEASGRGSYQGVYELNQSGPLVLSDGFRSIIETNVTVRPDRVPEIELIDRPTASNDGLLRLVYEARDDYGTHDMTILIWKDEEDQAEVIEYPLPARHQTSYQGELHLDLASHRWSGQQAWLRLSVRDALAQVGQSKAVNFTMPERHFKHPLAQKLIALRKVLAKAGNRLSVAAILDNLFNQPGLYDHDIVVSLSLTSTAKHLLFNHGDKARDHARNMLWQTALRLETGRLSIAQEDLRNLQKQLQQALSNNADMEQISSLLDQLQNAVDNLLSSMMEEMMGASEGEPAPLPENAQLIQREDLQKMIDQARFLAENGAMDEAQRLLSELQNMLENLSLQSAQNQGGGLREEGRKTFDQLQDLMQRQEELLEHSHQRKLSEEERAGGQQGPSRNMPGAFQSAPPNGGQQMQGQGQSQGYRDQRAADALTQEQLRQELQKLMEQMKEMLGALPEGFNQSERSMGEARDWLDRPAPFERDETIEAQTRSLRKLESATEQAADRFLQMLSELQQRGSGMTRGREGMGRDPFGRTLGNSGLSPSSQSVGLPNERELQRSRDILEELRKRHNDRTRPPEERDYLKHLLERF